MYTNVRILVKPDFTHPGMLSQDKSIHNISFRLWIQGSTVEVGRPVQFS